ncbi:MAG: hypothetical protein JF888_05170 [Candidatus Dormibacteraeota bacterium]|uniref:Uncharacterized protein n=1 Tax=Candidatus Dormiibacter inghamiae TaxID=3127013 RepID=A0A934NCY4_9BACT|nr:hypothetical protein [Candidatus Dormibacteraeota bacterium]MBJ7606002.1 hypothetical protein [Candidatus Dormibacteraeota bacterium]
MADRAIVAVKNTTESAQSTGSVGLETDQYRLKALVDPLPLSVSSEQSHGEVRLLPAELVELSQEHQKAAVSALAELLLPLL